VDKALDEFDRARSRMGRDFRTMITDSEDLLKAAASVSGEGFNAARTQFEEKLRSAKASLSEVSQPVFDRTRETAAVADDYVRTNPWTSVGVAMAAGALIGFIAARR
jgi:ElaB/YqjD/DUF883 family membrane-anchored ribosome-binding protein